MAILDATTAVPRADLRECFLQYNANADDFVARKVLPVLPVDEQAAELPVVTRKSLLGLVSADRKAGGDYQKVNAGLAGLLYNCKERGLEHDIPLGKQIHPSYNAEQGGARLLRHKHDMLRESIVAALLTDTGAFTAEDENYSEVKTDWRDPDADVIADIAAARQAIRKLTGLAPTALTINDEVFAALKCNKGLLERMAVIVQRNDAVMADAIAPILGLKNLFVSGAVYDTKPETPGDIVGGWIWPTGYASLSVTAPVGAPLEIPCIGRTLDWTGDGGGLVVESYFYEKQRINTIRARENVQENLFDTAFGHLLKVTTGS